MMLLVNKRLTCDKMIQLIYELLALDLDTAVCQNQTVIQYKSYPRLTRNAGENLKPVGEWGWGTKLKGAMKN